MDNIPSGSAQPQDNPPPVEVNEEPRENIQEHDDQTQGQAIHQAGSASLNDQTQGNQDEQIRVSAPPPTVSGPQTVQQDPNKVHVSAPSTSKNSEASQASEEELRENPTIQQSVGTSNGAEVRMRNVVSQQNVLNFSRSDSSSSDDSLIDLSNHSSFRSERTTYSEDSEEYPVVRLYPTPKATAPQGIEQRNAPIPAPAPPEREERPTTAFYLRPPADSRPRLATSQSRPRTPRPRAPTPPVWRPRAPRCQRGSSRWQLGPSSLERATRPNYLVTVPNGYPIGAPSGLPGWPPRLRQPGERNVMLPIARPRGVPTTLAPINIGTQSTRFRPSPLAGELRATAPGWRQSGEPSTRPALEGRRPTVQRLRTLLPIPVRPAPSDSEPTDDSSSDTEPTAAKRPHLSDDPKQ